MEPRSILEWEIGPPLRTVPGVIEVNAFGGQLKIPGIQARTDRLVAFAVALSDVFTAVAGNEANAGGACPDRGRGLDPVLGYRVYV